MLAPIYQHWWCLLLLQQALLQQPVNLTTTYCERGNNVYDAGDLGTCGFHTIQFNIGNFGFRANMGTAFSPKTKTDRPRSKRLVLGHQKKISRITGK
jgi:hypothetical protein